MKWLVWLIVAIVVIVALLIYLFYPVKISAEQACINSGGTVTTQLCCNSATDFPNTCLIGACGCGPNDSHQVKVCDCGEGKCLDSEMSKCV